MFRTAMIAVAAGMVAAAPVQAQSHQHGATPQAEGGAHAMKAHAMDASHRYAPGMLLKHAEDLKLTADQVAQLETIKVTHKQDCQRRMAAAKAAEAAAAEALSADQPDLARYEADLLEAAKQKVDCKVDMARITQRAKALLTTEQRQHVSHMAHGAH